MIQSTQVGLPGIEQGGEGLEVDPEGQRRPSKTEGEQMSEAGVQGVRLVRYRERQLKGAPDSQAEDCWGHRVRTSERRLTPFTRDHQRHAQPSGVTVAELCCMGYPWDTGFKLFL